MKTRRAKDELSSPSSSSSVATKKTPLNGRSQQVCNRCKAHNKSAPFKGHTCPWSSCKCPKCMDYLEKIRHKKEAAKKRQQNDHPLLPLVTTRTANIAIKQRATMTAIKRSMPSKAAATAVKPRASLAAPMTANKSQSKSATTAAASAKSVTPKITTRVVNGAQTAAKGRPPEKLMHIIKRAVMTNARPVANNSGNGSGGGNDSPPRLLPEQSLSDVDQPMVNDSHDDCEVTSVVGSVAPESVKPNPDLCAKYVKVSGDLSNELAMTKLSSDQLLACLKYAIIEDCLGDLTMATDKIALANQKIAIGAAHLINKLVDHQNLANTSATATTGRSANGQLLANTSSMTAKGRHSSPMTGNYNPNIAVNYSPSFTTNRRNLSNI